MNDATWARLESVLSSPWAIIALTIVGAVTLSRLLVRVIRPLLAHAAKQTSATWDDSLVKALASPMSVLFTLQGLRLASPWIPLEPGVIKIARDVIALLTAITVLWGVFRSIDIARSILEQRSWARDRPASRSLLAIAARFTKVLVLLLGIIVALAELGVSVGSLIAGLGIGGLALALAAQKTVENLFGTVSIGVDQPMREGDFVKVNEVVGTVEEIGLRSTRIRTLDRTLVTIPNGALANDRIETFAVRDRIRLAATISLVYNTRAAQLRAILVDLEAILRAHPKIWTETVIVRFKELASSSLDIEVMAWFQTADWNEFLAIRQDILIAFMEAVEKHGSAFAFPTRTIHVAAGGGANGHAKPASPTDGSAEHPVTSRDMQ